MKILIFSPDLEYYRDNRGVYRFSIRLISALKKLGHEVDLISSTVPVYEKKVRKKRKFKNVNLLRVIKDLSKEPGASVSFKVPFVSVKDLLLNFSFKEFSKRNSFFRAILLIFLFPFFNYKRYPTKNALRTIDFYSPVPRYLFNLSGIYNIPYLSTIATDSTNLLSFLTPTIRCSNYDIVIQTQPFNIKVLGAKLFTVCHDLFPCWSDIHPGDPGILALRFLFSFRNSQKILTISESNKILINDFLETTVTKTEKENMMSKLVVIQQSVSLPDDLLVQQSFKNKNKEPNENCFVTIGTLEKRKKQHVLVNLFLNNKSLEKSQLHLIGGADFDYLKSFIPELYLKAFKKFKKRDELIASYLSDNRTFSIKHKNVFWHCNAPDNIKNKLLANSKAMFFPSLNEGYGIPVVEGMLLGVPVVASKIKVFEEISKNLTFFSNEEELYNIIIDLITKPIQRSESLREEALLHSTDDSFGKTLRKAI